MFEGSLPVLPIECFVIIVGKRHWMKPKRITDIVATTKFERLSADKSRSSVFYWTIIDWSRLEQGHWKNNLGGNSWAILPGNQRLACIKEYSSPCTHPYCVNSHFTLRWCIHHIQIQVNVRIMIYVYLLLAVIWAVLHNWSRSTWWWRHGEVVGLLTQICCSHQADDLSKQNRFAHRCSSGIRQKKFFSLG